MGGLGLRRMVYKQRPEGYIRIGSEMCKTDIRMFHAEEPGYAKANEEKRSWPCKEMKEDLYLVSECNG